MSSLLASVKMFKIFICIALNCNLTSSTPVKPPSILEFSGSRLGVFRSISFNIDVLYIQSIFGQFLYNLASLIIWIQSLFFICFTLQKPPSLYPRTPTRTTSTNFFSSERELLRSNAQRWNNIGRCSRTGRCSGVKGKSNFVWSATK